MYTPQGAWTEGGRVAWRHAMAAVRTPAGILELAAAFERDAWRDEAKFATWRGDAAALRDHYAGRCPGMSRDDWTKAVAASRGAADAFERIRELDYYSSSGIVELPRVTPPASTARATADDAAALLALLPSRQQATHPLHAATFPSVGDPVFVAAPASRAFDLRAAAFAAHRVAGGGAPVIAPPRGTAERRRSAGR